MVNSGRKFNFFLKFTKQALNTSKLNMDMVIMSGGLAALKSYLVVSG